jgi:dienelactone hydrolase
MIPVEFVSSGSIVQGYLFRSVAHPAIATVVFLQGFPGIEGDELICGRLAREGVNVLTFNYRGTFRSEGIFSFSNAVSDAGAALQFAQEPQSQTAYQIDPARIVLGGWSFGGAMVPAAAARFPELTRIFLISGRNFGREASIIERDPEYAQQVRKNLESIRAPNGPVRFGDDLLADLIANQASLDHERLAPSLKDRDILLIGGWQDTVVPVAEHILPFHRALAQSGARRARLVTFEDDHEFLESQDQLIAALLSWLTAREENHLV